MNKKSRQSEIRVLLAGLVLSGLCAGCKPDEGGKFYMVIPNSVFVSGELPGTTQTQQTPVVTPPSTTAFTPGETYTWNVDFSSITEITVAYVIVYVVEQHGYYVVLLEEDELEQGKADVTMELVEDTGDVICNRDYRGNGTCYGPAPSGTTEVGFGIAAEPPPDDVYPPPDDDPPGEAPPAGDIGMSAFDTEMVWFQTLGSIGDGEDVGDDDGDDDDVDTGGGSDDGSDADGDCYSVSAAGCCNIEACCTPSQCWYNVNGQQVNCSGTDCSAAASTGAQICASGCI